MLEETRARRRRRKERQRKQFGSGCVAVIKDVPSRLRVTKEETEQIHVLKEPERRWTSDTRTKKSIGNRGPPVNRFARRIWVDVSTKALATFCVPENSKNGLLPSSYPPPSSSRIVLWPVCRFTFDSIAKRIFKREAFCRWMERTQSTHCSVPGRARCTYGNNIYFRSTDIRSGLSQRSFSV